MINIVNPLKIHLKKRRTKVLIIAVICVGVFSLLFYADAKLINKYIAIQSPVVLDRNNNVIAIKSNSRGNRSIFITEIPATFERSLLSSEDKYFYSHHGFNPISILRSIYFYVINGRHRGSSTLSQQLVKILLENEQDRTFINKIIESFYTIALEIFQSKKQILLMYSNSAFLGNQIQGFDEASRQYFDTPLERADQAEIDALIKTIPSPSTKNPWQTKNPLATKPKKNKNDPSSFELYSTVQSCTAVCRTTIDTEITQKIRKIVSDVIDENTKFGAKNAAVVVIKVPENQVISIVGSPDINSDSNGHAINMALEPRPIGSTIKPLIYLNAFQKGARPYTKIDDREYKYPIGSGFPIYPKNYDGQYRGIVTMHEALSNSLNVPAVKTLEYVGLNNFYSFLINKLKFQPLRDLNEYQYGIALGGLEMDLLTLTHFLTIFPKEGIYSPLHLRNFEPYDFTPMSKVSGTTKISDKRYTQLVSAILNDRKTGVEQFGLESNLNLLQDNYAVKTGTSRDYHDSWTVGYTPDFVVGVWLGNSENTALEHVTGQSGAGRIWHDTMQLLFNSQYNKKTPLNLDEIKNININNSLDFGLPDDVIDDHINVIENKNEFITSPHDGDNVIYSNNISIPLRSNEIVDWYVNDTYIETSLSTDYAPKTTGTYRIKAVNKSGVDQNISISIINK